MCRVAAFIGFEDAELTRAKDLVETYHSFGTTRPLESWDSIDSNFSICLSRYDVTSTKRKTKDNVPFNSKNYVLAFNGEIFSYQQEKFMESSSPDDFHFGSNLIEKFGPLDFFKNADFQGTFLVFNKKEDTLFVFTDHFNTAGCFYAQLDKKIIISQEYTVVYKLMCEFFPENFENIPIQIVKNGYYLEINNSSQITVNLYRDICNELWTGNNRKFQLKQEIEILDKSLETSIISRIPREGTVGVLCGGGVDSSLILAKIYYHLRQKNQLYRLKVYTLGADSLKDVTSESANDLLSTKILLKHLDLPEHAYLRIINPPTHWYDELLDFEVFDGNPRLITPNPSRTQVRHTVQLSCILATIATTHADDNVKVLLSGDFADEIFAGYDSMFSNISSYEELKNNIHKKVKELPLNDAARVTLSCYYGTLRLIRKFYLEPNFKSIPSLSAYRNIISHRKLNQESLRQLAHETNVSTLNHLTETYHPIEIRTPYLSYEFLKCLIKFSSKYIIGKFDGKVYTKFVLRKLALKSNLPKEIALRPKIPFNEGGTGIKNSQRDYKEIQQAILFLDDENKLNRKDILDGILNQKNHENLLRFDLNQSSFKDNIEDICLIHCAFQNGLRNVLNGNTFQQKLLPSIYETETKFFNKFVRGKHLVKEKIRECIINEAFVEKVYLRSKLKLNLIMAKQQLMYAPLFLALSDLLSINKNISLSIKSRDNYPKKFIDDNKVVDSLYHAPTNQGEINIYVTGELDLKKYKGKRKNKILSIASFIHRLPVQFIKKKNSKYPKDDIVYTFPDKTTFIQYVKEVYKSNFGNKIKGIPFNEIERRVENENVLGIVTELGDIEKVERIEGIFPPIKNIPFTILYTQIDTFLNQKKREVIIELKRLLEQKIKDLYVDLQEVGLKKSLFEYQPYKAIGNDFLSNLRKSIPPFCFSSTDTNVAIDNLIWMAKSGIWGVKSELEYSEKYEINTFERLTKIETDTKIRGAFIKSAISNIMARGLSHAMGSHVLPEFRNYYTTLFGTFLRDSKDIKNPEDNNDLLLKEKFHGNRNMEKDDFIWHISSSLTNFFNYLQQRMELIADVTNNNTYEPYFNFSLRDIFYEFKNYENSIFKGLFDSFDENGKSTITIKIEENIPNEIENVSIPGGQLGVSAFYLILEGVMRNYYKHALAGRIQNNYNFLLNISEPENENLRANYLCVDIVDCHGDLNKEQRTTNLLNKLQSHIDHSIVDNNNKLRQEGWGFIEMKSASAYLINYPLEYIEFEKTWQAPFDAKQNIYPEKLLEAKYYYLQDKRNLILEAENNSGNITSLNLGYRFYLLKPKTVLVDRDILSESQKKSFLKHESYGIYVKNIEQLINSRSEHEIIITNKILLTNQRYVNCTFPNQKLDNPESILNIIWEKYSRKIAPKDFNIIAFGEEISLKKHKLNTIWDSHGDSFGFKEEKLGLADIKSRTRCSYYHYSSKFNKYLYTNYGKRSSIKSLRENSFSYAIVKEMLNINISIFDERIQKEVNKTNGNQPKLSLRDTWELCGVFIPPVNKRIGAEISPYDLDKTEAKSLIDAIKDRLEKGDNYIIIHYTLFEKMANGNHVQSFYENLPTTFNDKEIHKKIVFDSGIRNPSTLVKDCLFINLSTLTAVTVNSPCKYSLIKALKSI